MTVNFKYRGQNMKAQRTICIFQQRMVFKLQGFSICFLHQPILFSPSSNENLIFCCTKIHSSYPSVKQ
jgi:hypothetical protein